MYLWVLSLVSEGGLKVRIFYFFEMGEGRSCSYIAATLAELHDTVSFAAPWSAIGRGLQVRASVSQQLRFHNTAASRRRAVVQIVPEPSTRPPAHLPMCPERRESMGAAVRASTAAAVLARTAALRHGGEACLDFKDSASPLLEACGKVQADHTAHPRQLAWPHS